MSTDHQGAVPVKAVGVKKRVRFAEEPVKPPLSGRALRAKMFAERVAQNRKQAFRDARKAEAVETAARLAAQDRSETAVREEAE